MEKIKNPLPNAKLERYPQGHITQFFGENPDLYAFMGYPGHPGIDIYQPYGTLICAATDGKIANVHLQEANKLGGLQIDLFSPIQEDGFVYETIYAHCSEILVAQEQEVKAGDPIGRVGNSGFVVSGGVKHWQNSNPDHKGTHLHLGLRIWKPLRPGDMESLVIQNFDNKYHGWIDPMPYLQNSQPDAIIKDMVTREQLNKLYLLAFDREPDNLAIGYLGMDWDFVLSELLKSQELQKRVSLWQAIKTFFEK